jgi:hypothetical protein
MNPIAFSDNGKKVAFAVHNFTVKYAFLSNTEEQVKYEA